MCIRDSGTADRGAGRVYDAFPGTDGECIWQQPSRGRRDFRWSAGRVSDEKYTVSSVEIPERDDSGYTAVSGFHQGTDEISV